MFRLLIHIIAGSLLIAGPAFVGCGTTRSTDTNRTASEQLLISDAIDRAVQSVNLKTLSGQTVFLDDSRLGEVVDRNYLISTLRQHLLASGCQLRDEREKADFVVEARAGAIGTDRNDLLFGVPTMQVPQIYPLQPVPGAAIPEIPIAKRRDQKGIAKLAVFAYHRETGTPVWQSGLVHQESSSNDVWILGAGPFQRGSIYDGTAFAGKTIGHDDARGTVVPRRLPAVHLARESTFTSPQDLAKAPAAKPGETEAHVVVQTAHEEAPPSENAATSEPNSPGAATPAPSKTVSEPDEDPAPAVAEKPDATLQPKAASVYVPQAPATLPQPRFTSR